MGILVTASHALPALMFLILRISNTAQPYRLNVYRALQVSDTDNFKRDSLNTGNTIKLVLYSTNLGCVYIKKEGNKCDRL